MMKSAVGSFLSIGVLSTLIGLAFAQNPAPSEGVVFERFGNQWFEGPATPVSISPDAKWALFGRPGDTHLYSLRSRREESTVLMGNLDGVDGAVFCGSGSPGLARLGHRGGASGWFLSNREGQSSTPPAKSVLVCSPDGSEVAYWDYSAPQRGIFIGTKGAYRSYGVKGAPTSMVFSHDGGTLYYLAIEPSGESSLSRIQVHTGESETVASHLDATPWPDGSVALSPDGKRAYLALASAGAPENEARHKPTADRWLKIYEMDLATGARRRLIESPGQDNSGPVIANGSLYWARTVVHDSIVTVPIEGGGAKEVIVGGELPMWNPSGSQIGYFIGGWRMADWALNLDDAVVSIDANGKRTSEPSVIVSGYHEDFPPAWSPNGKWIAYHSHRSPSPVPGYSSPGSTDDVYLRLAADLHAPEIRLTDFGWETGPAYWSPDGQKLLFVSYKRGGQRGYGKLWVIGVDTEKGAALKTEMMPLPDDIRSVQWGMWSPDGKEIAIEDDRGGGKRFLWIVRADGSHPQKLLEYEGTTYGGLDWTHDGNAIVYSGLAGDALQLFSIARAGGAPRKLTNDSGNLMHPRVSPDGRLIACTRLVQSKQIRRRPLP